MDHPFCWAGLRLIVNNSMSPAIYELSSSPCCKKDISVGILQRDLRQE
jgi:hypothetical protein